MHVHHRYLMAITCTIAHFACSSPEKAAAPGDRWWADVKALASDGMEGRQTGSDGYRRAAQYVAEQFERLELQPAGTERYFQPVDFESRRMAEERSRLELSRDGKVVPVRFGDEAIAQPFGVSGQPFESEMVFAGYGLTIPEYKHDDFAGLNVAGKVVIFVGGAPSTVPSTVAAHYSSIEERASNFARLGAVGVIGVMNPRLEEIPWARLAAMRSQFTQMMDLADPSLKMPTSLKVAAFVSSEYAPTLMGISPARYAEILKLDAEKQPLPKFNVPGMLGSVITYAGSSSRSDNVVAVFAGSDPTLKDEYVLLSAHLDHVGVGDAVNGDSIYNGAMDNASGVATLLEVARMLRDAGERPKRSLLFLACTGEEMGLLGSKYFAGHPTVPIGKVVANINLDMFLPIVPLRLVRGYGVNESDLAGHLEAAAKDVGVAVQDDPEPERNIFIRSDQYSFIKQGVPALFLSAGWEPGSPEDKTVIAWFSSRYHAPSDDLNQPVNLEAADRFIQLMTRLTVRIANAERAPQWKEDSFFRTFASRRSRK
jgi:hypothetical protein